MKPYMERRSIAGNPAGERENAGAASGCLDAHNGSALRRPACRTMKRRRIKARACRRIPVCGRLVLVDTLYL